MPNGYSKTREKYVGKEYVRLVVLDYIPSIDQRPWIREPAKALCQCVCGQQVTVRIESLERGDTTSCGCLKFKHGMSESVEYQAWANMKDRCLNPNHADWHNYGGRGITVCQAWQESFKRFYADVGSRPSSLYSLGRIDNNGNYTPENCEWQTADQQQRNRRDNHILTLGDESACLVEWAEHLHLTSEGLWSRLKRGWTIERALTTANLH